MSLKTFLLTLKGLKGTFIISLHAELSHRCSVTEIQLLPRIIMPEKKYKQTTQRIILLKPLPVNSLSPSKFSADVSLKLGSYFKIFIRHLGFQVHHSPGGNSNVVFIMQTAGNSGNGTFLKVSMAVSTGKKHSCTTFARTQLSSL